MFVITQIFSKISKENFLNNCHIKNLIMPKKKTAEEFETDFNLRMEDTKLSKKASKLFANDKEV